MHLSIAICDDEKIYQSAVENAVILWTISNHRQADITIRTYNSGEDLLYDLEKGSKFELVFLDIEIPGETSGLNIAKKIYTHDPYTAIVFVTNYSSYACEGYEVNALRYIVKPFANGQINDCLDIVWKKNQLLSGHSVIIKEGSSVISVPLSSIISIEAMGHNLTISTSEHIQYTTRQKLSDLITRINSDLIIQCHRSYAVNLMYVRKITPNEITLTDNTLLPLSKKYTNNLYSSFINYHQGR